MVPSSNSRTRYGHGFSPLKCLWDYRSWFCRASISKLPGASPSTRSKPSGKAIWATRSSLHQRWTKRRRSRARQGHEPRYWRLVTPILPYRLVRHVYRVARKGGNGYMGQWAALTAHCAVAIYRAMPPERGSEPDAGKHQGQADCVEYFSRQGRPGEFLGDVVSAL